MKAMGAYLWALRDSAHLSRDTVAKEIDSNRTQIERIDRGDVEAGIGVVMAYAKIVGANLAHIQQLRLQPDATPEDGRKLAEQWLTEAQRARLDAMIEESGEESIREAVQRLRNLPPEERLRVIAELSYQERARRAGASVVDTRSPRRGWTRRRDGG